MEKNHDTPICKECGGRTATVSGTFYYSPDEEPYNSGIIEKSLVGDGECWVVAFICDDCGNIQNLQNE